MDKQQNRQTVRSHFYIPDLSAPGFIILNRPIDVVAAKKLFELFVAPAELNVLIDEKTGTNEQQQENNHDP